MSHRIGRDDVIVGGDNFGPLLYNAGVGMDIEKMVARLRENPRWAARLLATGDARLWYAAGRTVSMEDGGGLPEGAGVVVSRDGTQADGANRYGLFLESVRSELRRSLEERPLEERDPVPGTVVLDAAAGGMRDGLLHVERFRPEFGVRNASRSGVTGFNEDPNAGDVPWMTWSCPFGVEPGSRVRVGSAAEASFLYEKGIRGEIDWEPLFDGLRGRGLFTLPSSEAERLAGDLERQFSWMRERIVAGDLSAARVVTDSLVVPDTSLGRSVYDPVVAPSPAHVLARYLANPALVFENAENTVLRSLSRAAKDEPVHFTGTSSDLVTVAVVGSDTLAGRAPGTKAVRSRGVRVTYVEDSGGNRRKVEKASGVQYRHQFKEKPEQEADYADFSRRMDEVLSNIPAGVKVRFLCGTGIGTPAAVERYVRDRGGSVFTGAPDGVVRPKEKGRRDDPDAALSVVRVSRFDEILPVVAGVVPSVEIPEEDGDGTLTVRAGKTYSCGAGLCFSMSDDDRGERVRRSASLLVAGGAPFINVVDCMSERQQLQMLGADVAETSAALVDDLSLDSAPSLLGGLDGFDGMPEGDGYAVLSDERDGAVWPYISKYMQMPVFVSNVPMHTVAGAYAGYLLGRGNTALCTALAAAEKDPAQLEDLVRGRMAALAPSDADREAALRKAVRLMLAANESFSGELLATAGKRLVCLGGGVVDNLLYKDADGNGRNLAGAVLAAERDVLMRRRELRRDEARRQEARMERNQQLQLERSRTVRAKMEKVRDGFPGYDDLFSAVWFLGNVRDESLMLPEDRSSFEWWRTGGPDTPSGAYDYLTRGKAANPTLAALDDDGKVMRVPNRSVYLSPTTLEVASGWKKPPYSPYSWDLTGLRRVNRDTGEEFVAGFGLPVKLNRDSYEVGNPYGMPCSFRMDDRSAAFRHSVINVGARAAATAFREDMSLCAAARVDRENNHVDYLSSEFFRMVPAKDADGKSTGKFVRSPHYSPVNGHNVLRLLNMYENGSDFPLTCVMLPSRDYVPAGGETPAEAKARFMADLGFSLDYANELSVELGVPLRFPLDAGGRVVLGPDIPEEFLDAARAKIDSFMGVSAGGKVDVGRLPVLERTDDAFGYRLAGRPLAAEFYARPVELAAAFGNFGFQGLDAVSADNPLPVYEMTLKMDDDTLIRIQGVRSTRGLSPQELNSYLSYDRDEEMKFKLYCADASKGQEYAALIRGYVEAARTVDVEYRPNDRLEDESLEGYVKVFSSNSMEMRKDADAITLPNRFDNTAEEDSYPGWVDFKDGFEGYIEYRYRLADGMQSDWKVIKDTEFARDLAMAGLDRRYSAGDRAVPSNKVLRALLRAEAVKDRISRYHLVEAGQGLGFGFPSAVEEAPSRDESRTVSMEAIKSEAPARREPVPTYEVSSKGDRRFSALYATFREGTVLFGRDVGGMSVEDVYQKVVKRSGRGRAPARDSVLNDWESCLTAGTPACAAEYRERHPDVPDALFSRLSGVAVMEVNAGDPEFEVEPLSAKELEDVSYYVGYLPLWKEWASQNPDLVDDLRDRADGRRLVDSFARTGVSQARALTDIIAGIEDREAEAEAAGVLKAPQSVPVTFEESRGGYAQRTKENAEAADVTFAFACDFNTAGERCTAKAAGDSLVKIGLPVSGRSLDTSDRAVEEAVRKVRERLVPEVFDGKTPVCVNVAGNGVYTLEAHGVSQKSADLFVTKVLSSLRRKGLDIASVRSGGQTGIDEAGVAAGVALGIPSVVRAPHGWVMRNAGGTDCYGRERFVERFALKDYDSLRREAEPKKARRPKI